MVRLARLDRRVAGAILHVDSPGGSALASDRMHHEIVQLARQKPVVACMANVAASGGYYVAAPAHRIVCEPTTITGSIGVVGARLAPTPLFDKIGVRMETIRRGRRAGLLAPFMPLADDERAALGRELGATYQTFVDVVARGRKMPAARVEELARGRVYTGQDALAVGLVDAMGGFAEALRVLRGLLPAHVRELAQPRVLRAPMRPLPLLDPPKEGEAGKRAALAFAAALLPDHERALFEIALAGERVAALAPLTTT
jgi:protease-4